MRKLSVDLQADCPRHRTHAGANTATPAILADIHLSFFRLDYIVETGAHTALAIRAELPIDHGPLFGK
jgi:hypothetical protein